MEITVVAVNSLLPKLYTLVEKYNLEPGAEKDIHYLSLELKVCYAIILDSEKHHLEDFFLRRIRELSYDIEDAVDSFMIRVGGNQDEVSVLFGVKLIKPTALMSSLTTKVRSRYQISQLIHELKPQVQELSMRIRSYHRDASPVISSSKLREEPRLPWLYTDATNLIGIDRPRHELTKLLLMEERGEPKMAAQFMAVSIVGFGGIGKTTLARVVYNTISEHFDINAWVSVSLNPNMQRVLVDILHQVGYPNISGGDERNLIERISEALQEKRYLLVLDDLWDTRILDIIKLALPLNNRGSRVITTTRNRTVAAACCSHWNGHIYEVLPLSSSDSWMLFNRRIFGDEDCPPMVQDIAVKLLRKCSGLPLAIASISALLASKPPTRATWEDLYNSMTDTSESMEGVSILLQLSYNDLPHNLRVCFLYLSTFPEDYQISCDRIIRCWIAEGLLSGNRVATVKEEKVAESYLNELVNRNMIQPIHYSYDGKLVAFRIHDLLLDFIRSVSYKEDFLSFVDISWDPESVLHKNFRRLSIINTSEHNCIPQSVAESKIRSLFISVRVGLNFSFKNFTVLRVLDLEGCKDLKNHHIFEITKLHLLRYLSIRDTPISEVPDRIGQLRILKTLDLRGTKVPRLPRSIAQLRVLEHLLYDRVSLPQGIGKMESLSSLSQFDIFGSKLSVVEELGNLSKLRELELWWFPDTESNITEAYEQLVISLNRLNMLQSLCIHGSDNSVDLLDHLPHPLCQLQRIQLDNSCYLRRIPEWFGKLIRLEYLCIDVSEVKNGDLQLLAKLGLRYLSLSSRTMPTEKLIIRSYDFPVLQNFHLQSAKADIQFEPRAMPKLVRLQLSLHVLPEEIQFPIDIYHLACLKKIDIRINGQGRDASEWYEAANALIRKAADEHPNHPAVKIITVGNFTDYTLMEGKKMEQKIEPSEVDYFFTKP